MFWVGYGRTSCIRRGFAFASSLVLSVEEKDRALPWLFAPLFPRFFAQVLGRNGGRRPREVDAAHCVRTADLAKRSTLDRSHNLYARRVLRVLLVARTHWVRHIHHVNYPSATSLRPDAVRAGAGLVRRARAAGRRRSSAHSPFRVARAPSQHRSCGTRRDNTPRRGP